ncbi:hypothetical protein ACIQOU_34275 [Streptomyces sp. NPDC091279]|uniref:hypothetical protein n=1 Tax=unclassified Streptomyces TaxID=2593676 RepID=UPI0037F8D3A9
MAVWGLIVESTQGAGEGRQWACEVAGRVTGTREDALRALETFASTYRPTHPRRPKRVRLFRQQEGLLLISEGTFETFHTRFTVAELLHDSAPERG